MDKNRTRSDILKVEAKIDEYYDHIEEMVRNGMTHGEAQAVMSKEVNEYLLERYLFNESYGLLERYLFDDSCGDNDFEF